MPDTVEMTITCHAEECANAGVPITVTTTPGAIAVCGACGGFPDDVTTA